MVHFTREKRLRYSNVTQSRLTFQRKSLKINHRVNRINVENRDRVRSGNRFKIKRLACVDASSRVTSDKITGW